MNQHAERVEAKLAELRAAEAEMEAAEKIYKAKKARVDDIIEQELPDLMEEIGFKKFETTEGAVVKLDTKVHCSIPAAKRADAYAWLEENGHAGIIKSEVTVAFPKGAGDGSEALRKELSERDLDTKRSLRVEAATMSAWAREQLADGEDVPDELFTIHRTRKVTVK